MNDLQLGFYSVMAGGITSGVALSLSALLDNFMDYTIANFIGLFVAMFVNFILQERIFLGRIETKQNNIKYFIKYFIADLLILGTNQILFYLVIKYKKKLLKFINKDYYNLIWRTIIGSIVWMVISFPIRKNWVFNYKKNKKNKENKENKNK